MDKIIVYHNPRCSKSRQVINLLKSKNIQFEIFLYLESKISHGDLVNLLSLLQMKARAILRMQEKEYKENNLHNKDLTDSEIIKIVLENRKLIERPIVINGNKAVIARPPEKVFGIL